MMSASNLYLLMIKPGESFVSPIEPNSIDGAVDSLIRIFSERDFFHSIENSFLTLNASAAAEPNKPQKYESLDPVVFSMLFTQLPLGSSGNRGWNFAFIRFEGKIKFLGLTQL
jgi:hypothetical protein